MTIKAIIFDIGGVLVKPFNFELFSAWATIAQVDHKEMAAMCKIYWKEIQRGIITEQEFFSKVCKGLNIKEQIFPWTDHVLKKVEFEEGTWQTLEELDQEGYAIGILSNIEEPVKKAFLQKTQRIFDAEIYSCEVGLVKPEQEIYKKTCEALGILPEEGVFIDDKEQNITAAKECGLHGIVFKNPDQLERELTIILEKFNSQEL